MAADIVLVFTEENAESIRKNLLSSITAESHDRNNWEILCAKVDKGNIVSGHGINPNIVTINSRVHIKDLKTKKEILLTLVFPEDAHIEQGKLSVLSPMGTAILGHSVGNTVAMETPYGIRHIRITNVIYQPETSRAGL